jgi:hypothetical protein
VIDDHEVPRTLATMATAGRRRLTFEEMLAAGRPAVYRQFGDHLLYVGGRLFDVRRPEEPTPIEVSVSSSQAADEHEHAHLAVGIEYGWRHAADCSCSYCSASREAA